MWARGVVALALLGAVAGCADLASWQDVAGPKPEHSWKLESGSGTMVAPGVVLTARHVVESCKAVRVTSANGVVRAASGRVVARGRERDADLALVRLDGPSPDVPAAHFAALAWPDDAVFADWTTNLAVPTMESGRFVGLGYPGRIHGIEPVVTPLHGLVPLNPHEVGPMRRYLVFGRLQPGDSGGPVIDSDGRVAGVMVGAALNLPELFARSAILRELPAARDGVGTAIADAEAIGFLRRAGLAPQTGPEPPTGSAVAQARASLVRVFCWN